jgi:hypothetical protein
VAGQREYQRDQQRSEHRSELVECLVDPEAPAVPHALGRVREHRIARRIADRLADPFQDDQHRGHLPGPGQRQKRNHGHLQQVAADRDRPVQPRSIGATPGEESQAVAEQLAGAGDHGDRERAGAQQPQVLADDAARALVSEVGEETHHADQEHELQRGRQPQGPSSLTRLLRDPRHR